MLKDAERRKQYDAFGANGARGGGPGGASFNFDFGDLGDESGTGGVEVRPVVRTQEGAR